MIKNIRDDIERKDAVFAVCQSTYSLVEVLDKKKHNYLEAVRQKRRDLEYMAGTTKSTGSRIIGGFFTALTDAINRYGYLKTTICDELCDKFKDDYYVFSEKGVDWLKIEVMQRFNNDYSERANKYISIIQEYEPDFQDPRPSKSESTRTNTTQSSTSNSTQLGGCYVATAVYGSYDCPQVWTLRRYRDFNLAKKWYGRAFINLYYTLSPSIVKWFGDTVWFKEIWKRSLDRLVFRLNQRGIKDTPYEDQRW